jgi:hypothetical protein
LNSYHLNDNVARVVRLLGRVTVHNRKYLRLDTDLHQYCVRMPDKTIARYSDLQTAMHTMRWVVGAELVEEY